MIRLLKTVVSQNCGFMRQRDIKLWFRKKRLQVEFLKLQKDYSFDKTMILKTTIFVASKYSVAFKRQVFCKTVIFFQYFKNNLHLNMALCALYMHSEYLSTL